MPLVLIAGAALVLALAYFGEEYVTARATIRRELRAAFERYGLDGDWGEALGLTETELSPATVLTGGDARRGGSYGPTSISRQTARAYGYSGRMEALNEDPVLAADLTARMVAEGFAERGGSLDGDRYVPSPSGDSVLRYGRPSEVRDFLAVWNSGLPFASAPASTRSAYVPRALRELAGVQEAA